MSDPILGPSERDRMLCARRLGWTADETFRAQCAAVLLNPEEALIGSPLENIALQRARISQGGTA